MREYDLATIIAIQPFIQPRTRKVGLSVFTAVIRLKFLSTTRASLPSIPSTEITNREKYFFLIVAVLTILILLDFLTPIWEISHCLKSVGISISVEDFCVDDAVSIYVP